MAQSSQATSRTFRQLPLLPGHHFGQAETLRFPFDRWTGRPS